VYVCRAVKAGKGPGYCTNTTAVPRDEMHAAVVASLRETFSAEAFRAHQQRVANDTEARRQRRAQREYWNAELPKLTAKSAKLAKLVADLDDAGDLLHEYQMAKKHVQEAKDTLAYLDRVDADDVAAAADVDQLAATGPTGRRSWTRTRSSGARSCARS